MTDEEIIALAAREGFAGAAVADVRDIVFDPSFRPYCAENLCGQYGANHSCPPDCGTPEEMRRRVLSHRHALVLQTVWEISDYTDKASLREAKGAHNTALLNLVKRLRARGLGNGLIVGASGCALCSPCARAAGKPCRFPDLQYSCMSAYCIFVRKLAEACGLEYDPGPGLLAFFGMYVYD